MDCLLCGKKLNVLRQLHGEEFCSAAHRKTYLKKQNDSAVDFLIQSKPRYKRAALPAADPASEPESAPETQREVTPSPANFFATPMVAASLKSRPLFYVACYWMHAQPALPAVLQIESGKVRSCTFSCASLCPAEMAGRIENLFVAALEFPMASPRVPARLMQPMWMGAAPVEAVQQRNAGYVKPMIGPMRMDPGLTYSAAVPPFAFPPLFLNGASVLTGPLLRMATAAQGPAEISRCRGNAIPFAESVWSSPDPPLQVPRAAIAPAVCRLRTGARIGFVPSPSEVSSRLLPAATTYNWANEAPQVPTAVAGAHPAFLRTALRTPLSIPRHVIAAGASPAGGPAGLIWRLHLHLAAGRQPIIRPEFNSPERNYPVQLPESAAAAPPESRVNYSQRISPSTRRLIVSVTLILATLALIIRLAMVVPGSAREGVYARIHARAAIDLQDDFRSGLSQWTGISGWAETWSYDPTGFARPGRLALFAHATPLTDYRLDFLAQIENKSVTWVFRASDVHNYYVTTLLQSKSATNPSFSMVRYAVTGGREGPKTHLPLAFAAPGRRLFWVRQEIRDVDFTTYIDGQVVDTWSDSSLAHGGIGFFSDFGEAAYIRSVQVAENNDLLGKLCSLIAPADRK